MQPDSGFIFRTSTEVGAGYMIADALAFLGESTEPRERRWLSVDVVTLLNDVTRAVVSLWIETEIGVDAFCVRAGGMTTEERGCFSWAFVGGVVLGLGGGHARVLVGAGARAVVTAAAEGFLVGVSARAAFAAFWRCVCGGRLFGLTFAK